MTRQRGQLPIGFHQEQATPLAEGADMVGSDEDLREAEERLERDSKEPGQAGDAGPSETLNDVAPALPEDVAKKILRDAFKHFPIPGKK